jgi:L-malate glycosyltransferase
VISPGHRVVVLYTDARSLGGAEVHLARLASSLDRYEPILVLHELELREALLGLLPRNMKIIVTPRPESKTGLIALWHLFRVLARFRRNRPDVLLHCHLPTPENGHFAAVLGRVVGLPVLCTEHIRMTPRVPRVSLRRRLMHRVIDQEIAVSSAVADSLIKDHGQDPSRITVIPNGVDPARYSSPESNLSLWSSRRASVRNRLGIPADASVVGSVGRLEYQKNYSLLLDAVARVQSTRDVYLVIAGEGTERPLLQDLAKGLHMSDRVRLPGHVDNVPELYAAFDLFVLSSRFEGLPLVLLEAMASGLPCLSTAADGVKEVITDGVNGILTPLDAGPETLAERLTCLLIDGELRTRLARAGTQTVQSSFSLGSMTDRTQVVYDRVLAARRHR